jgi:DNA topoisomerase-6 subunit B
MFGLGATMAILYGQITTNKPVVVKSSTDGKTQDEFQLLLDIQKNKPIIV